MGGNWILISCKRIMKHCEILQIISTIILVIFISILLLQFKNYSNFSKEIIIPLISVLCVKYLLGDWDSGYSWTILDIFYWTILPIISYLIVKH
jgi:hypothetical protein